MSTHIHQSISLLYIIILFLPIVAFFKSRNGGELHSARIWKIIVMLANIALFGSLITGFILYPVFTSPLVWISVALVLAIGAFLGIFSKQLKLYRLENDPSEKQKHLQKIAKVGFFYIATVIIIFVVMFNWYNFLT